jgi:hypothetical protein
MRKSNAFSKNNYDMNEWQKKVKTHYTKELQLGRIEETINFITNHVSSNRENERSTFSGVWGYLDVDKEHLKIFKRQLKIALKQDYLDLVQIIYNKDDQDIIVTWRYIHVRESI